MCRPWLPSNAIRACRADVRVQLGASVKNSRGERGGGGVRQMSAETAEAATLRLRLSLNARKLWAAASTRQSVSAGTELDLSELNWNQGGTVPDCWPDNRTDCGCQRPTTGRLRLSTAERTNRSDCRLATGRLPVVVDILCCGRESSRDYRVFQIRLSHFSCAKHR